MIFSIKEILSPFLTIFSYPEILQDHILSPLELPHRQSTHTDTLFLSTVLFYGMLFLMPSFKSNSLIYCMLLYIVFSFDIGFFVHVVFGCFCIVSSSLCVFCLYLV